MVKEDWSDPRSGDVIIDALFPGDREHNYPFRDLGSGDILNDCGLHDLDCHCLVLWGN